MTKNIILLTLCFCWVHCQTGPTKNLIVDQLGYRPNAPKFAMIANPINGQNAPNSITPGTTFQIRRVSDNVPVFNGTLTAWNAGNTDGVSGDKVWWADFSSLTTSGKLTKLVFIII
jgi:endoglucanase